ncbi:MAG TPA: Gfo/Idh/MocA family oxidoreductase [Rhizobiaceae bacterium]|nr:Gfo/Idh/MocA family oxidoreductase [Rhizobiaceae bacterium]
MQEQTFRWGMVGAGAIARQFAADLKYAGQMQIAAVCSRNTESADVFRTLTGAARAYTVLGNMLADPGVDAVYIATPNHLHVEQAVPALQAGKPVLVEKPLATTVREAEAMAATAAESGVLLMEGLWTRFLPAVDAVRAMLAERVIGDVLRVKGELAYFHVEEPGTRFFDPVLGGGAALDLGVYLLSLAIDLFGAPESVDGRWQAARSGVDRRTDFRLRFASGAEAELSCGFDRDGDNAFTIVGSKGAIRLHPPFLKAQQLTLFSAPLRGLAGVGGLAGKALARFPVPGVERRSFAFPGGGLQFEAAAFTRSVGQGERQNDVMPVKDSIAVLKLVEAVKARPPENSR